MMRQQNKKFSSPPKETTNRSISPKWEKLQNKISQKIDKKNFKLKTLNEIKCIQSQNFDKKHSFFKDLPQSTKEISNKNSEQNGAIKEIRVPSFVKKSTNHNKNNNSSLENIITINQTFQNFNTKQQSTFESLESLNKKIDSSTNIQEANYKKLNDKINYLQKKIIQMKDVLDHKRQEKIIFMENQRNQRMAMNLTENDSRISIQAPLKQFISQMPQHKDLHTFLQNPYSPRHSIYYVSQILRAYKKQKSLARQHIYTSLQYLRMLQYSKTPEQKIFKTFLPKVKGYEDKKTVIFDLDETLIHCTQSLIMPSDLKIDVVFPTGENIQVGINIRPYARQILAALSKKFQIIVFTASHSCYANVVIDHLDPERKFIHHRLFREHCCCTPEGIYVKDLRILNRPLSKVILVDNAAYSYAYQLLNGVPIIPYYEGKNDYELPALQKYIQSLIFASDVREKNRNIFKLDRYTEFDNLNKLVETLYGVSQQNT